MHLLQIMLWKAAMYLCGSQCENLSWHWRKKIHEQLLAPKIKEEV